MREIERGRRIVRKENELKSVRERHKRGRQRQKEGNIE